MIRVNLLRRVKAIKYRGHHKRDAVGNVVSRAAETRRHRLAHPGQRKRWDTTYRQSEAGEASHQKYNDSEKGQRAAQNQYLQWKYGKGLADKAEQHEKQQGLCGVCGKPLSVNLDECHWDHNHKTGELRDVVHPRCNIAIGFIESELLTPVLTYLKRHDNV
jgi:hypothetical protein